MYSTSNSVTEQGVRAVCAGKHRRTDKRLKNKYPGDEQSTQGLGPSQAPL